MNERIIRLFRESGLSKYALAQRSGVPYTTVNEILNARTDINRCASETVFRLASVLRAPPETVINDIHILDGHKGKHRGLRYTLRFNGEYMDILFRYGKEDVVLSTGQKYRIPEGHDDYLTFAEWRIDEYIDKREFEEYAKGVFSKMD